MKRLRRWWPVAGLLMALLVGVGLMVRGYSWQAAPVPPASVDAGMIERGAYLAKIGGCVGCHSRPGAPALSGGVGVQTPFGRISAPNLTPDAATGLGRWSLNDFAQALHAGRSRDGRLLYPAFPYEQYSQMRSADVQALYAYLQQVPAVVAVTPPHSLRWPYNQQWALALWRGLFFAPASPESIGAASLGSPVQHEAPDSAALARGAYGVQVLSHCVACHAPRNAWGALGASPVMSGGQLPSGWYAPSLIDPAQAGVSGWSQAEVVALLRAGGHARATASGPMAEAVAQSLQYLTAEDAADMAVYLRSLGQPGAPAALAPQVAALEDNAMASLGGRVYGRHCVDCHGQQGQGEAGVFPALAGNRAVAQAEAGNLIRLVLDGGYPASTAGRPMPAGMPPFRQLLSDAEIAAVLTFIRRSWGHNAAGVDTMEVYRQRERH